MINHFMFAGYCDPLLDHISDTSVFGRRRILNVLTIRRLISLLIRWIDFLLFPVCLPVVFYGCVLYTPNYSNLCIDIRRVMFKNFPLEKYCTRNANIYRKVCKYSNDSQLLISWPSEQNCGPRRSSIYIEIHR